MPENDFNAPDDEEADYYPEQTPIETIQATLKSALHIPRDIARNVISEIHKRKIKKDKDIHFPRVFEELNKRLQPLIEQGKISPLFGTYDVMTIQVGESSRVVYMLFDKGSTYFDTEHISTAQTIDYLFSVLAFLANEDGRINGRIISSIYLRDIREIIRKNSDKSLSPGEVEHIVGLFRAAFLDRDPTNFSPQQIEGITWEPLVPDKMNPHTLSINVPDAALWIDERKLDKK